MCVADLIIAERAAFERFMLATRTTDEVRIGREPTDAELDEYDAASDGQGEALEAVIGATPGSAADLFAIMDLFLLREVEREIVVADADMIRTLFETIRAFVLRPPSGRDAKALRAAHELRQKADREAQRADAAERDVRTLSAENARLRARLRTSEACAASAGLRP